MKNKPKVPGDSVIEKPVKSSLSPHYKRAQQIHKAMLEMSGGENATTRTALINAKIELNNLMRRA